MPYKGLVLFAGTYLSLLLIFFISAGISVHGDGPVVHFIFMMAGGLAARLAGSIYQSTLMALLGVAIEALIISIAIQLITKKIRANSN